MMVPRSIFTIVYCIITLLLAGGVVGKSIYETFIENFDQKCAPQNYVQQFHRNQYDNPFDQYVVFTFHAAGLRNGGIGDRLGGLISATALAIALNRTLILRAENGFFDLFQPLHPNKDIQKDISWSNAYSWSNFDEIDYIENRHDPTQSLDMDDCVSNSEEGFNLAQRKKCAFLHDDFVPVVYDPASAENSDVDSDSDDESVKYIHFTSNRCYLCMWRNATTMTTSSMSKSKSNKGKVSKHPLYSLIRRVFPTTGKSKLTDMYEVAGCLLRLTMHPTEALWNEAENVYSTMKLFHPNSYLEQRQRNKKNKLVIDDVTLRGISPYQSSALPIIHNPVGMQQLGVHFRCGDIHSYAGLVYGGGKVSKHKCVFDEEEDADIRDFESIGKSRNLNAGNPMGMGVCAQSLLRGLLQGVDIASHSVDVTPQGQTLPSATSPKPPTILFVTSDNIYASQQIAFYAQHNVTIVSTQGCHIELDPSALCLKFTTAHWFVLSLSHKLITQTYGDYNFPTSAFSRYAVEGTVKTQKRHTRS
eukprot:gene23524-28530_t